MRIVFAAYGPVRGQFERLAEAVNRYTEHEARYLGPELVRDGIKFSEDEPRIGNAWWILDEEQKNACLEWADVIHCSFMNSAHEMDRPDLIGEKLFVYQYFTKWHPRFDGLWAEDDYAKKRVIVACVAEGWHRYIVRRDYHLLPSLFLIDDDPLLPRPFEDRDRRVSFAPSTKRKSVAAPKGYHITQVKLKGFKLELLFRLPWRACMRAKARAWVGIDEVVTPIFHFSGMEYLALGVPCINMYDDVSAAALKEVTGADTVPFINADIRTLRKIVDGCLSSSQGEWARKSTEARDWMEKFYHPRELIQRYIDLYDLWVW